MRGKWGVGCICIYACMYASMQRPPPISLSLHLSCVYRSISFGNEVWRERKGRRVHRGKINKFSPPTLKMHIHFHTLERQWDAYTLAAVSPICARPPTLPPPRHTQRHTYTRKHIIQQRWMHVSQSVGAGENLPLAIFIFIRAEGACVFVLIHSGCVPGHCVFVFVCLCVNKFFYLTFKLKKKTCPALTQYRKSSIIDSFSPFWFLNVMYIKILQHVLRGPK